MPTKRRTSRRVNRRSIRRNNRRSNRRSNRRNARRTNRRSNRRNTRRTNRRNLYGGGPKLKAKQRLDRVNDLLDREKENKKILKKNIKRMERLLHESKGLIDLQSIEIEEQKAKINIIRRQLAEESIRANECCEKCSVVQEPSKIKTLPHTNLAPLHTANIPNWTDIAPNASPTDNESRKLLELSRSDLHQGNIDKTVVPFVTGADLSVIRELGESSSDNP